MANLIEDLGVGYVNDNLSGALLFHNNVPHLIQEVRSDRISTTAFQGNMAKPVQVAGVNLPAKLLDKGFESLAHPPLGYRTAAAGKVLLELKNKQSFKRGLQLAEVITRFPPVTTYIAERFDIDLAYYMRSDVKAVACVENCFIPLAKGLEMIKAGEIFVFAISPKLAVIPCSRPKEYLEIVYEGRPVGNISIEGVVTGKITNVKSIMENLNGK